MAVSSLVPSRTSRSSWRRGSAPSPDLRVTLGAGVTTLTAVAAMVAGPDAARLTAVASAVAFVAAARRWSSGR